jgi:long-subunit fatty acid transport protein
MLMALLVCAGLFAQGEMDAIRLSDGDLRGTARGQAMAGAFGALGGDVTGIMINPAGLGVYRSSEVNATMALNSAHLKTDWQNTFNRERTVKFNFDNISYIGYYPTGNMSVPVLNFAFTYNRLKNFNRRYSASGQGMQPSLTAYIAAITKGVYYNDMNMDEGNRYDPYANPAIPWLSTLGWLGFLINDVSDNSYSGLFPDATVSPRLNVNEQGCIESYDFSLGTNFSDKFYLGMTFALTDISYVMNSSYGEEFSSGGTVGLSNSFKTEGAGFQFVFGGIYRPFDFLRLGIAYHSPVLYSLEDYYQGHTTANYPGASSEWAKTPDNALTRYRFNTPGKWVFSTAGIIGTKAIVSLDYEVKNYGHMYLMDPEGLPKKDANKYIDEDFKVASTFRAGLEYRLTPQFSARVGYSYAQNPYEQQFQAGKKEAMIVGTVPHYTIDGDVRYITGGIGYRFTPNFYIDATLVYRTQKDDFYYFPSVIRPEGGFEVHSLPGSLTNTNYKVLVTAGYKF